MLSAVERALVWHRCLSIVTHDVSASANPRRKTRSVGKIQQCSAGTTRAATVTSALLGGRVAVRQRGEQVEAQPGAKLGSLSRGSDQLRSRSLRWTGAARSPLPGSLHRPRTRADSATPTPPMRQRTGRASPARWLRRSVSRSTRAEEYLLPAPRPRPHNARLRPDTAGLRRSHGRYEGKPTVPGRCLGVAHTVSSTGSTALAVPAF